MCCTDTVLHDAPLKCLHTSSHQTFHFTVDTKLLHNPLINMENAQANILMSVYIQRACIQK